MSILKRRIAKLEAGEPTDCCVTLYSWPTGEIHVFREGAAYVDRKPEEPELAFAERALAELSQLDLGSPRVIWALHNRDQEVNRPKQKPDVDRFHFVEDQSDETE
jgi:hypothetical protein